MSGLIWAGIGQGIANAGRTAGDFMMRSELEEERQREKAELQRERLAATERENERNRQLRADIEAGRAARAGDSGGGLSMKDIGEGGSAEGLVARQAGMTVPELRAFRRSSDTGDLEPFKRDVTRYGRDQDDGMAGANDEYSDAVSRKTAKLTEEKVRDFPPGFEQEYRAKLKTLARIEESYLLGKNYEPVAKGRQTQQEVDASQRAMESPAQAGIIGQGIAAGQGKDLIGGDSNVTRNKFTGETTTTDVGKSVITENQAQAKKYGADADRARREPTGKNEDLPTLQQMRKAAEETLKDARKALTEFDKANTGDLTRPGREKLKEQRDALAAEVTNARGELQKISDRLARRLDETEAASKSGAAPKPAPAPAAPESRKVGDTQTIQAGPNKGKTARWDGRGWVLVN